MVRQAREMIEGGEIGDIRVVNASYIQDWPAIPISLALFVIGLELEAVSADLATFVPGRRFDDNAYVLMRFAGGARSVLSASQVAVGNLNNLSLKVYGSRAGVEWRARNRRRSASRPMASRLAS
jgi:predicted dehydrogenase